MRPKYLINEKSAFTIFIVLVAIPIVYIIYQKSYLAKRKSLEKIHLVQINHKLDSLKSIQIEIVEYDIANQTNSILDSCECLPNLTMDYRQSENPLNLADLTKDAEYQNVEELQRREKLLIQNLDSIQQSMNIANQKLEEYALVFDSLSPRFTLSYRENIQQLVNTLHAEAIQLLDTNIAQLKGENKTIHFFIYFIRFLSVIILLLFPVRWVLIYYWEKEHR